MDALILITTALSVSLDSFFCGISMSVKTKENFKFLIGISLTVLLLCLLGSGLGLKAYNALSGFSEIIGGSILIIIAIWGFFDSKNKKVPNAKNDNIFLESIIIGFAIGLDGAVGSLSLSLMGYNSILVPILITVIHVILMHIAILISKSKASKILKKFENTPQIILLLLGTYKLITGI